jgi:adenylyl-sulfate kinase
MIIWLTGLSGSGKSTLATGLSHALREQGIKPLQIDGDSLREALCKDLGFSPEDRSENIRRAGAMALLAARSGIVSICSLISPLRRDRDQIRALCEKQGITFLEVYISAPLDTCERRDPKGLYKRARAGEISDFTGINAPYEPPLHPELLIRTDRISIQESLQLLKTIVERLHF